MCNLLIIDTIQLKETSCLLAVRVVVSVIDDSHNAPNRSIIAVGQQADNARIAKCAVPF